MILTADDLKTKSLVELREIAKEKGIKSITKYRKSQLIEMLAQTQEEKPAAMESEDTNGNGTAADTRVRTDTVEVSGILEVCEDGFGFLRCENYLSGQNDVYVSPTLIRRFRLKTGDDISGIARLQRENERFKAMLM